jgi:ProP effector
MTDTATLDTTLPADAATHTAAEHETAAPAQPASVGQPKAAGNFKQRAEAVQPVLEKLFELYPQLFGAQFLPLKLGVFQELLAANPTALDKDTLKIALSVHTRSTRYLQSVAAGMQRHGLDGQPVEPLAPEHIYFAMLELHRRRFARAPEEIKPKLLNQLRAQLINAFEASGLERQDYLARVQTNDANANVVLEEALAQLDKMLAKEAALLRAYDASGKTPVEFADMYGMNLRDVKAALARRG